MNKPCLPYCLPLQHACEHLNPECLTKWPPCRIYPAAQVGWNSSTATWAYPTVPQPPSGAEPLLTGSHRQETHPSLQTPSLMSPSSRAHQPSSTTASDIPRATAGLSIAHPGGNAKAGAASVGAGGGAGALKVAEPSKASGGQYVCAAAYPTPDKSLEIGRRNVHVFRSKNTRCARLHRIQVPNVVLFELSPSALQCRVSLVLVTTQGGTKLLLSSEDCQSSVPQQPLGVWFQKTAYAPEHLFPFSEISHFIESWNPIWYNLPPPTPTKKGLNSDQTVLNRSEQSKQTNNVIFG